MIVCTLEYMLMVIQKPQMYALRVTNETNRN